MSHHSQKQIGDSMTPLQLGLILLAGFGPLLAQFFFQSLAI